MPWPTKKLGELVDFLDNQRKPISDEKRQKRIGPYPYYGANGQVSWIDDFLFDEDLVLLAEDGGYFGSKDRPIAYRIFGKTWVNNHAHVLRVKRGIAETGFIHYRLMFYDIKPYITGSTRTKLNKSAAEKIKIPLPPLSIQKQIVERLDKIAEAQKINDELIQKANELFQSLLHKEIDPVGPADASTFVKTSADKKAMAGKKNWEVKKLGEVCEIARGGSPRPINKYLTNSSDGINWIKIGDVKEGEMYITSTKQKINPEGISKTRLVKEGDFILSNSMSFGRPYIMKISGAIHDGWLLLHLKNTDISTDFLYYVLGSSQTQTQFEKSASGGVVRNLNSDLVRKIKILVPPIEVQKQIVEKLSAVQEYKKQLLTQKLKLKELFDSVLYKSMNGEFT